MTIDRTNFESMVRDAKVHYSKIIEDGKRDIHSISLNDIGDSIKFFGVLLKSFNVEKSLFGFQESIRDGFKIEKSDY